MSKEINKDKIKKYFAVGILTTALFTAAGLNIVDAKTDHTEELCVICRIESSSVLIDGQVGTVGIQHQLKEMEKDYLEKGQDVNIEYNSAYQNYYDEEEITRLSRANLESGGIYYSVPKGYKAVELDGVYYALPNGFTPKLIDGEYYGVRINRIYTSEPEPAIIVYGKDSETSEYDEEINIIKLGK